MDMCEGFQSQPCTSIHHTYNDTLEWLGCCEMPESAKVTQSLCESGIQDRSQHSSQPRPKISTEANFHPNPDTSGALPTRFAWFFAPNPYDLLLYHQR